MTPEFELRLALLDQITQWGELAYTTLGMFITVVSGFLVMTFFVGAQLKKAQSAVVICIYLAFACFTMWGTFIAMAIADTFDPAKFGLVRLSHFHGRLPSDSTIKYHHILSLIQLAIVAASLWFFFDIRRNAKRPSRTDTKE